MAKRKRNKGGLYSAACGFGSAHEVRRFPTLKKAVRYAFGASKRKGVCNVRKVTRPFINSTLVEHSRVVVRCKDGSCARMPGQVRGDDEVRLLGRRGALRRR